MDLVCVRMFHSYLYTYFDFIKLKCKNVFIKIVSIAMMIGGAVVNALAFTGSGLKSSDVEKEQKRHDLALEQLTKARDEWSRESVKYLDYVNDPLKKEASANKTFTDINEAMNEHYVVIGSRFTLPPNLREEPKLDDFYVPSEEKKTERSYLSSWAWE